ncbi:hypothetical protein PIIN_05339 [Serendipita indica DSM 11827]|uniref:ferric-chelate reductase (NADPH) n=1 Tax=Serendipita indica (strain DSM 11827) TaxID=1109443 RepID=G4TJA9_SERID|nr:hypothetical protein PIIN_05339 [Serendipita indica DSM 11827]
MDHGAGGHGTSAINDNMSTTLSSNSPSPTTIRAVNPLRAYIRWQQVEYPRQLWYFVATGLALLTVCNIVYIIRTRLRKASLMRQRSVPPNEGGEAEKSGSAPGPALRSTLQTRFEAFEAAFKIISFRWSIPAGRTFTLSLTEVFFTTGYLAAVLIWSFIHSRGGQRAFWAERTAAIASRQAPLLTLLSGKNNLVTLLTGLSYEKVNIMHRAVGRTLFLVALLHSAEKFPRLTPKRVARPINYTGIAALLAFTILLFTSFRPIRNRGFETFLYLHIFTVIIYIVAMYYHWPEDAMYLWLLIGFWALDRIIRGIQMIRINRGNPQSTKAIVQLVADDSVRLVLPQRQMRWRAGQHVFLTLPGVSKLPFESHPMTLANIPDTDEDGKQAKSTDLVFYIRAMDGFTRKLYEYAINNDGKAVTTLVDGPYGTPPDVNSFTTVIFIAGGSGIASTLPLLLDILSNVKRGQSPVRRVVFVWSVKSRGDLQWAVDIIKATTAGALGILDLDIRIHISRAQANEQVPSLRGSVDIAASLTPISPSEKEKPTLPIRCAVVAGESGTSTPAFPMAIDDITYAGRPDLPAIIDEEIRASKGPVAIVACGPGHMTATVRHCLCAGAASSSTILRGGVPVSMFIENFGAVRSSS